MTFPPQVVPQYEPLDFTDAPETPLGDVEVLTDAYIEQSTALRRWAWRKNEDRKLLRSVKQDRKQTGMLEVYRRVSIQAPNLPTRLLAQAMAEEIQDEMTPDYKRIARQDRMLLDELQHTFTMFVDIKSYEDHAATRQCALELRRQQEHPPYKPEPRRREPSKAVRLFGSYVFLPSHSTLPADNRLYFWGSPLEVVNMTFDEAVVAGVEDLGDSQVSLAPNSPPVPPSGSPGPLLLLADAMFPFEEHLGPALDRSRIPDWFLFLEDTEKLGVAGKDSQGRWNRLLNQIVTLQKDIESGKNGEKPKSTWDKEWHEPSPQWPLPHRQQKGGWWKCRLGPDAPAAERECHICHDGSAQLKQPRPEADPEEILAEILDAIAKAMKLVADKDKRVIAERSRQLENGFGEQFLKEVHESIYAPPDDGSRRQPYSLLRGYED
ncbi:hypothetical protein GGS23DRAFT_39949 [Durotheca rogersii]|uniref:uncharacterized protein n=1 Tax=Durotheca rogersii TaxID=419775 RepID=UPI00222085EE|nr:uncharacterized protein GGS23DRAFT_39949 [Durotheca rogersii]KAI5868623.1 hypothetical protein GGS23DRAFT_39949 [Durotheca rogersii]